MCKPSTFLCIDKTYRALRIVDYADPATPEPPSENACRFNRSMQHHLSRSLFQRCIHEGEAMETIAAWGFGLFGKVTRFLRIRLP